MVMKLNKMVFDDKKIEESARGAADLYEQDLPMMSYNEDTEVDGQHHFCQEFGAELFKEGAKWAINELFKNLWHPASEEPRKDVSIIVEKHIMTRICFTMLGTDGKITFIHRGLTQFFVVEFLVGFILMIYFQRKEEKNEKE